MWRMTFDRKQYWICVSFVIALKFAVAVSLVYAPESYGYLRYVDIALVIVLLMLVGGRFSDAGWPRWLGIVLVILLTVVAPLVLMFVTFGGNRLPANPFDLNPDYQWIVSFVLLALLIVAGAPKSRPASSA